MFTLLKNAEIYTPEKLGEGDILFSGKKIIAVDQDLSRFESVSNIIDLTDYIITPGLIDQHIHLNGAGGKNGFASMTPDITLSQLISCGTTTAVGLLGTDGTARSIKSLYAKVKSLCQEGVSAYMFCGYYGIDTVTITESIQGDMIFIDKVLGCKIAISDIRSSYPTAIELVRKLRDVTVGGYVGNKKGILHIHLGNLASKLDVLFELVEKYQFPIEHISPTHVARTKELFEEAIKFAKLGGIIDITTGASKYTEPYKAVLYALESGVSINRITFSSDGHAGLSKLDKEGNVIGSRVAPIDQNLAEVIKLIKLGKLPTEEAFQIITSNPADNLGLKSKGRLHSGSDADICVFDKDFNLIHVFAKGKQMMKNKEVIVKGTFES